MGHSFLELQKYKQMYYSFLEIGEKFGHSSCTIKEFVKLLPENIRVLFSQKWEDDNDLYYNFIEPYRNLPENGVMFGGSQIIPLEALYVAMYMN